MSSSVLYSLPEACGTRPTIPPNCSSATVVSELFWTLPQGPGCCPSFRLDARMVSLPTGGRDAVAEPATRAAGILPLCLSHLPDLNRRPTVYETVALPTELRWRNEGGQHTPGRTGVKGASGRRRAGRNPRWSGVAEAGAEPPRPPPPLASIAVPDTLGNAALPRPDDAAARVAARRAGSGCELSPR
jgi:hypothetical protein